MDLRIYADAATLWAHSNQQHRFDTSPTLAEAMCVRLCFATAQRTADPVPEQMLLPWNWNDTGVVVWSRARRAFLAATDLRVIAYPSDPSFGALRDVATARASACDPVWSGATSDEAEYVHEQTLHLRSFLAQLTTEAAPIPYALGVALIVAIRRYPGIDADTLSFAPTFDAGGRHAPDQEPPADDLLASDGWAYAGGAVRCHVQPVRFTPPAATTDGVDERTQWVQVPQPRTVRPADIHLPDDQRQVTTGGIEVRVLAPKDEHAALSIADEGDDVIRRFPGFGISAAVVDQGQVGPWRMLNRATLRAWRNGLPDWTTERELSPTRPALARRTDKDPNAQLERAGVVEYLGRSLVGEGDDVPTTEYDDPTVMPSWIDRKPKAGDTFPALQFGRSYVFACWAFGNGGVLPVALTGSPQDAAYHPARARPGVFVPGSHSPALTYQRTHAISAPTLITKRRNSGTPAVGALDDGFSPRELVEAQQGIRLRTREALDTRNVPSFAITDVVSLKFALRAPATDLATWVRWVPLTKQAEQLDVLTGHRWACAWNDEAADDALIDASLDDPAMGLFGPGTAPALEAELVPVPAGAHPALPRLTVPLRPGRVGTAERDPYETVPRALPVPCTVEVGAWGLVPDGNGGLVARLPRGAMARLLVRGVPEPGAAARFDLLPHDELAPAFEVRVEAADEIGLSAVQVGALLQAGVHGDEVVVALAPHPRLAFVDRVELARQVWHWKGRSIAAPGVPHDPPEQEGDARWKWEARAFGERSDLDAVTIERHAPPGGAGMDLFHDDRTGDRRATVARFSLTLNSRYEKLRALFPEPKPFGPVASSFVTGQRRSKWKSLVVPCRFAGEVPPPAVRLAVPLSNKHLLVLVDEPWFEIGGAGERLEVQISRTEHYDEFGPDPARRLAAENAPALEVDGPYGLTFDPADAPAPRFRRSCFVVRADRAVDRCFAKLSFRRRLPGERAGQATGRASEVTPPRWVQFLGATIENLDVSWQASRLTVIGLAVDTAPPNDGYSYARTVHWVLATNTVRDISGHDVEVFSDLAERTPPQAGGPSADQVFALSTKPDKVRVLEVWEIAGEAASPAPRTTAQLIDALFPSTPGVEASAMILAVSAPFTV